MLDGDGGAGDCNGNGAAGWIRTGPGKGFGDVAGQSGNNGTLLELIPHNRLFYRAELWRYAEEAGGLSLAALTNPIYISAQ